MKTYAGKTLDELQSMCEARAQGILVVENCYSGGRTVANIRCCDRLVCVNTLEESDAWRLPDQNARAFADSVNAVPALVKRVRALEKALRDIAGDGANARYCGCEHYNAYWVLDDKQKDKARALLADEEE